MTAERDWADEVAHDLWICGDFDTNAEWLIATALRAAEARGFQRGVEASAKVIDSDTCGFYGPWLRRQEAAIELLRILKTVDPGEAIAAGFWDKKLNLWASRIRALLSPKQGGSE